MALYSEEDLAAHQEAINRALGLGLETQSPPDTDEQEELIEIEDTTEEDSPSETEDPFSSSQASSPRDSYRLELTIDLTDSPPVSPQVALPASPVASQSRSLAQPSNPQSPAMQCPVCLDTFSAIRSRGEHGLFGLCSSPLSLFLSGLQLVSTVCGHVFCLGCLRQCLLTQQQCPTCRRRIAHQDYHPLFL